MKPTWLSMVVVLGAVPPTLAKDAPDAGTHVAATAAAPIRKLEPAEFRTALEKARASGKYTLVDVREPEETADGYVQGAELMPYTSGVFAKEHAKVPKDRPVLLYCASGGRASRAAQVLVAEGWKDVTVLSGGGYPDLKPGAKN